MSTTHAFGLINLFIALLSLFLAGMVAYKQEKTRFNQLVVFIYILLAFWLVCNTFKQCSTSDTAVLFWHEMRYIAIASGPALFLIATCEFTHTKLAFLRGQVVYSLFLVPGITVLLAITNHMHGFFQKSMTISRTTIITVQTNNGPWYYVHAFYSYGLILICIVLLIIEYVRQPQIYKNKAGIILAGFSISNIISLLYDSHLFNIAVPLEMTPVTYPIVMLFVYYALYQYKPLRVISIARNLVIDNMHNPVILFDINNITLDINNAAAQLIHSTRDQFLGRSIEDYPSDWYEILTYKNTADHNIVPLLVDGQRRYFEFQLVEVKDAKQKPIGRLIVLNDISQLKEALIHMGYLSTHDQLTGLRNRFFFEQQLDQLDHPDNYPLGIVVGDLNGLKLVNDSFGHEAGDDLLKKAAEIFNQSCADKDNVFRIGGDEFAIILSQNGETEILRLIDMIKNECESIVLHSAPLSISFGFAVKHDDSQSMPEILKLADELMYKHKMLESKSVRSAMISTLQQALSERNIETETHLQRTSQLAVELGRNIKLPSHQIDDLGLLGLLHDAGKLGIPDYILLKPTLLNEDEWKIMKQHSEKGYRIAYAIPELVSIAEAILYHHERWDGQGYPSGLAGNEIPILSRIIAVVDTFDVLTHDRPYRLAISPKEALEEIRACAGTQFDPEIANVFINCFN